MTPLGQPLIALPTNAQSTQKEAQIQLALQAIKQDTTLSVRRAAAIYNVPKSTILRRRARTTLRRDYTPNSMKLLKSEEEAIVQYILDLDTQGFPPQLATIRDMADSLLTTRH